MEALGRWFRRSAPFSDLIGYLWLIVGLQALVLLGAATAISLGFPELSISGKTVNFGVEWRTMPHTQVIVRSTMLVPFFEELVFRYLPLGLTFFIVWACGLSLRPLGTVIVVGAILLTSVVFGYIHGGIGNVFIQGLAGVTFGVIFAKWSGFGARCGKGLLASTIAHGATNALILTFIVFTSSPH